MIVPNCRPGVTDPNSDCLGNNIWLGKIFRPSAAI